ncbi:hypothetical protein ACS0PU_001050 [Formica fusca]
MMTEDWVKSKSAKERNAMVRRAEIARVIIALAYFLMGLAYIFVIVLPIFGISIRYLTNITDPGRPMPIQTHYMYDVTKTPQYELTYIAHSISFFIAVTCYVGIDNFFGLIVFHICGQLDILRYRLLCTDKFANFHTILKSCVMDHMRLLRYFSFLVSFLHFLLLK